MKRILSGLAVWLAISVTPAVATWYGENVDDGADSLTSLHPVDAESSLAAIRLRNAATSSLPLADALIAGVADAAGLILVHRDPHFDTIPDIKVLRLPSKR